MADVPNNVKLALPHAASAMVTSGWWMSPLHEVGTSTHTLQRHQTGQDIVSVDGSGTAAYTSWAVCSEQLLLGCSFRHEAEVGGATSKQEMTSERVTTDNRSVFPLHVWKQLKPREKAMVRAGKMTFDPTTLKAIFQEKSPTFSDLLKKRPTVNNVTVQNRRTRVRTGRAAPDNNDDNAGEPAAAEEAEDEQMQGDQATAPKMEKGRKLYDKKIKELCTLYDDLNADGDGTDTPAKLNDDTIPDDTWLTDLDAWWKKFEAEAKRDLERENKWVLAVPTAGTRSRRAVSGYAGELRAQLLMLKQDYDTLKATMKATPVGDAQRPILKIHRINLADKIRTVKGRLDAERKRMRDVTERERVIREAVGDPKSYDENTTLTSFEGAVDVRKGVGTRYSTVTFPEPVTPLPQPTQKTPPPLRQGEEINFYTYTIPVKVCHVSSILEPEEMNITPQKSALAIAIEDRINKTDPAAAMQGLLRTPISHDGGGMSMLVSYMTSTRTTFQEHAVLVRLMCMIISNSYQNAAYDPMRFRVVRNCRFAGNPVTPEDMVSMSVNFHTDIPPMMIAAISMETFDRWAVAAREYSPWPEPFTRHGLDSSWIFVPVDSSLLGTYGVLIPYLASFLSSQLWNGTINYHTSHVFDQGGGGDLEWNRAGYTTMPSANSVYIPGVLNIMLVLTSETVSPTQQDVLPHIRLEAFDQNLGVNVPIWRDVPIVPAAAAVNWRPVWMDWWSSPRITEKIEGMNAAYNHIRTHISTGTSGNQAMSVVAELAGYNYPGMIVRPDGETGKYNFSLENTHGNYTVNGATLEAGGIEVPTQNLYELFTGENAGARNQWLEGYLWSGLSPLGLATTSGVFAEGAWDAVTHEMSVCWQSREPTKRVGIYNIKTQSSYTRMACYLGLYNTESNAPIFNYSAGIGEWFHMCVAALSLGTAVMLGCNNLSQGVWSGFDTRNERVNSQMVVNEVKRTIFNNMVVHYPANEFRWTGYEFESIPHYWTVNHVDDNDWCFHNPMPYHAAMQWYNKNASSMGPTFGLPEFIYKFGRLGAHRSGVEIAAVLKPEMGMGLIHTMSSAAFHRHLPIITVERDALGQETIPLQFEDWVTITRLTTFSQKKSKAMWETSTPAITFTTSWGMPLDPNRWYVFDSQLNTQLGAERLPKVSPIEFPDPPSGFWTNLGSGLSRYLIKPALAALAGWWTGGPIGAAAAGAGTLVTEIAKGTGASEEVQEKIVKVEEAARNVLEVPKSAVETVVRNTPLGTTLSQNETAEKSSTSVSAQTGDQPQT